VSGNFLPFLSWCCLSSTIFPGKISCCVCIGNLINLSTSSSYCMYSVVPCCKYGEFSILISIVSSNITRLQTGHDICCRITVWVTVVIGQVRFCSQLFFCRLVGDYGFDPLGLGQDPAALRWYVQAELIHARFAMAGVTGILFTDVCCSLSFCLCLPHVTSLSYLKHCLLDHQFTESTGLNHRVSRMLKCFHLLAL
jgi:hypothetical protein